MQKRWQTIRDVTMASAMSLVLYASGLLVIFTPLPLFYVYVLRGRKAGLGSVALAFSIAIAAYVFALFLFQQGIGSAGIAGIEGSPIAIPGTTLTGSFSREVLFAIGTGYFLFFSVIACLLGEGALRKFALITWGSSATAGGMAVIFAMIAWFFLSGHAEILQNMRGFLEGIVTEVVKVQTSAAPNTGVTALLAERIPEIAGAMFTLMPAILFVFTLLCAVINMLVGRRIIRKRHAFTHLHNVARFKLPDEAVWVVILCALAFLGNAALPTSKWISIISQNGLICAGALYFFQGLAVVVYFLQKVKLPLVKVGAYAMILMFFQAVGLIIIAVGIADVWADFRLRSWRASHGRET